MAVFRIEKTKDYTVMSNFHLRDRTLTLKSKGLLSLMLSLPLEWNYTLKGLSCICQDGISSVRSGVEELEARGYLTRRMIRGENGQFSDIEYTIHEKPQEPDIPEGPVDNSPPPSGSPMSDKPLCDFPITVNPLSGNRMELSNTGNSELNKSNINSSNINQSIRRDAPDTIDTMDIYRDIIKSNIEYDALCEQYKYSTDELTEILELMLETVCTAKKTIRIGGEDKPAAVVKSQLLKVDQFMVEYVLECLSKNTTDIRNIKGYLLTTLYNAPNTISSYYKSRVNHDLYGDK